MKIILGTIYLLFCLYLFFVILSPLLLLVLVGIELLVYCYKEEDKKEDKKDV